MERPCFSKSVLLSPIKGSPISLSAPREDSDGDHRAGNASQINCGTQDEADYRSGH
jgi:hypothetical protein